MTKEERVKRKEERYQERTREQQGYFRKVFDLMRGRATRAAERMIERDRNRVRRSDDALQSALLILRRADHRTDPGRRHAARRSRHHTAHCAHLASAAAAGADVRQQAGAQDGADRR